MRELLVVRAVHRLLLAFGLLLPTWALSQITPYVPPSHGVVIVPPPPGDFKSIEAGLYHTCATRNDGKTYCWGMNHVGQVGVWTGENCAGYDCVRSPRFVMNAIEVSAGADHNCALDASRRAHCWGNNRSGQLGIPSYSQLGQPTPVQTNLSFVQISAGSNSSCAMSGTTTYCWGSMGNGVNGVQSSLPAPLPSGAGMDRVSMGYTHGCVLYVYGDWRQPGCFGHNRFGELGLEVSNVGRAYVPIGTTFGTAVVSVKTRNDVTCVDQVRGTVECAGSNGQGELGDGTYVSRGTARAVGGGRALAGVSVGWDHACAIDPNKRVQCWGNGYRGQLGNNRRELEPNPVQVANITAKKVAAGYMHTCAIGTDNQIYCWGNNDMGQLGIGQHGGWATVPVATNTPR